MGCYECLLGKGCEDELVPGDFFIGFLAASVINYPFLSSIFAGIITLVGWPVITQTHGLSFLVPMLTPHALVVIAGGYSLLRLAGLPFPLVASVILFYFFDKVRSENLEEKKSKLPAKRSKDQLMPAETKNVSWSADNHDIDLKL